MDDTNKEQVGVEEEVAVGVSTPEETPVEETPTEEVASPEAPAPIEENS